MRGLETRRGLERPAKAAVMEAGSSKEAWRTVAPRALRGAQRASRGEEVVQRTGWEGGVRAWVRRVGMVEELSLPVQPVMVIVVMMSMWNEWGGGI